MMMEQHEKTLEKVLIASSSKPKDPESKKAKEDLIMQLDDQKIRALELETLGEVSEGNSP